MEKDENAQNTIEGRAAVLEALENGRSIDHIYINRNATGQLKVIFAKAREAGVKITPAAPAKLGEIASSRNHQGVVALCPAREYCEIADLLEYAAECGEPPFIVLLDGITDAYNYGAILRSALAAGAHGVVVPKRRQAPLSGAVSKASAGAAEYIRVARVPNIAAAVESLKKAGLWAYAADMSGEPAYGADLRGPVALIIGGEGEGVSRVVREKCDFALALPMRGPVGSLNASVAAGVLMYEIVRARTVGGRSL
ncbi:MAG: 23S rRNA (guanosine(2251)-2'-O)-methyltransferase RlmB [Clostridiales bacterium]|jgi:23S rRNA (guanosine2251-2'-O)-methyltransferase|nr:23S rRNA (guanosine(2251)-2'-O)-methyltransferase RlmB [Clostridiales bacterium]